MKPLLFLSQRIPFPPNKGDKIRSFHVLRHLARSWRIHLGCFIDDPADWQHVEALKEFCADVHCAALDPRQAKLRSLPAFATGESLSTRYFRDGGLAAWLRRTLTETRPEAAFLYSSVMAQYLLSPGLIGTAPRPGRIVMDFVDVDSDKWRQYAQSQSWPMSWVYRRESRRLFAFDRAVARQADASIFVSPAEADLFRCMAPECSDRIHGIPNGIDLDFFKPEAGGERPYQGNEPVIAFTGMMDYWPNADAVCWFAAEILPLIRARRPEVRFYIVGGNPTPEVVKLGEVEGVTVTGRVADIRPYIAHADVAVAPLRIARGIQNKVLEAMAMARPMICTSQALEGIDALPGRDLLVADTAPAFAEAVLQALAQPGSLGRQGRDCVLAGYRWSDKLAQYESLIRGAA